MVFDCRSKQFMHFDSSSRNNARVAKLLARNAGNALGAAASGRAAYGEMDTPRQANGYDCGMYVICMVRAICEWIRQGKDIAAEAAADMSAWLTPKHVDEYRSTLLQCILDKVLQNK